MGDILYSQIVPDDTRDHVVRILEHLVKLIGDSRQVQVVYTDDYTKDHKKIESLFETTTTYVTST